MLMTFGLILAAALGAVAIVAFAVVRSNGASATTAAPAGSGATTWRDVAPIFAAKCAGCHQVGGIAHFALTSARTAARNARAILRVTQQGAMPQPCRLPRYDCIPLRVREESATARKQDPGSSQMRWFPPARLEFQRTTPPRNQWLE